MNLPQTGCVVRSDCPKQDSQEPWYPVVVYLKRDEDFAYQNNDHHRCDGDRQDMGEHANENKNACEHRGIMSNRTTHHSLLSPRLLVSRRIDLLPPALS